MATFQAQSGFTTDPETGCVRGYNDYEQCRTNYFLKQQNQILQDKQLEVKNVDGNAEVMGTTTQAQTQEADNPAAVGIAASRISPSLFYALTIIATVVMTVVITKYLIKGNKKL